MLAAIRWKIHPQRTSIAELVWCSCGAERTQEKSVESAHHLNSVSFDCHHEEILENEWNGKRMKTQTHEETAFFLLARQLNEGVTTHLLTAFLRLRVVVVVVLFLLAGSSRSRRDVCLGFPNCRRLFC